ncbi:transcriptional regulator Nrg1 [Kwoniella heveanensis CBS 569]|nr:transcriptional regulator Nrg1 [Kwoniella heveanensis CBS 569]
MSTETSPHQSTHLQSAYSQHSTPIHSHNPPHMPGSASALHDSYAADTSINSIKTDESSVSGSPAPASSKGKNGATGPAEGKAKPHVCPICNRGFTTGGHLQRHHRIHTGVKAFKCPFPGCETKTSRQDNLQQHYRTHLSPTLRRGSGSAARAAVNAAMEAAGLKSSSRQSRKSKGSAGGTPSSTASGHMPSPYATPTSQGPGSYAPYMYDPQHGYPPYPLPPPGVSLAQSQSAASSRVPSPVNGHSSGHSSVGSMPPAHQQPFFSQPYTPAYTAYPGQPYRYGPAGGIPSPYGAAPHPHHGLYSPGLASEHGQHMYSPMQSNFQAHSRESSYGVLTPGYGGQNPMANGYPPRTQTSTPLSQTHDEYGRRAGSPRRRSPPHDMLGQGVVDPSSMSTRMGQGMQYGYGAQHHGMPYGYGQPISQPHSRDPSGHRASVSSLSEDGSGNGGSEDTKGAASACPTCLHRPMHS